MDEEIDISALVQKYEQLKMLGKKMYLDADEFAFLADYYNGIGNNEEAEMLIDEGLRMHPISPDLMILKAKTMVFSDKFVEALEYVKSIADEDEIEIPLIKIECYLHLGEYEKADKLINLTLEKELIIDDLYIFITELGYLFNDVDKFDRAIFYLEDSMKIDESNPDSLIDLAYSYEMKGNFMKAIEYNNRLLDIDPYSFDGWVNIGKLYSMNEQYEQAISAFDFALTIRENDLPALKMKALSLHLNDNTPEAIRIFENCLKESLNDESLYDSLLEAYEAMERYDEMMKIIDRKEAAFGSEGILIKRALVHLSKEDLQQAKELFSRIPENEKETFDYHMLEGELAFYDNDFPAAEAAYIKAALLSDDDEEEIIDRLANISVAQEKYEQAAAYLEQLMKLDPDFPTVKSRLAFIRFEIGVKEPFDEIMEQFSDDELRSLLGVISGSEDTDFSNYNRQKLIIRLNEARENRVLFKNIKY